MTIITNFSQSADQGDFLENIPDHTLEAIDNYLIRGYEPGGFLTCMICGDWKAALGHADQANKQRFWYVASWLTRYAPVGSTGSSEAFENWIKNKDGIRKEYVNKAEADFEWRTLGGEKCDRVKM